MRWWLPRLRGPRRMFWRIYGYGVLMVLAALLTFAGGIRLFVPDAARFNNFRADVERIVEATDGAPEKMAPELERVASESTMRATVYRMDGELVATTVQPPPGPLDAGEKLVFRRELGWVPRGAKLSAPLWNRDVLWGYVFMERAVPLPSPPRRVGLALMGVLLALAGVALPLARALASPLERLTAAVREFGQGHLSARAGLRGRDEVAELGRTFDEMAERMEVLIRTEKALLANVSHELRTPLARLGVTLDLVEEGQPHELARRLPDLRRDLGELEQLVDGVLQMARLDLEANQAGQPGPRVQRAKVDPGTFLRETAERFSQAHPECPLTLEVESGLPPLEVDALLVRRALHNLLDNARKYSEAVLPVVLRARAKPGALQVEVEDRGVGVSPEDLPHLSSPFFRADRSRARDTGGVGLGLTLARRIVEAHGGTLTIASAPGEGTRITLLLPVAEGCWVSPM